MEKQLLTDEIIKEHLEKNGFMEEPDANWLLEYIEQEHGGKLDFESDWAKGHEDRIIYTQSTADSYELFVSTESHDWKNVYFEQDVYYYQDSQQFAEDIINAITNGGEAWCDPNIWSDLEYEFNYELEQWWTDTYEDLFDEAKDELLDSGDYYEEKED